jgi:hypothetical protein
MSFSTRKVLHQVYNESANFSKRKFDITKYQPYIEKLPPEDMLVIAFKEFPGNFARKFILITLKWWKSFDKQTFIQAMDKIYNDELALVYLVSFAKRYLDLDLTNLCLDKDLYLQPIHYFTHSKEWILELERMNVDIEYLKSLKEKTSP